MTTAPAAATLRPPARPSVRHRSRRTKTIIGVVVAVVVLGVLAIGTKFVSDSSPLAQGPQKFSAAKFGEQNFAKVRAAITKRAVAADTLAAALKSNSAAATRKYAQSVSGAPGPEFSVSFSGTVGGGTDGIYAVKVAGVPKSLLIRMQTGPAINGTDLRDATGLYTFGQFTNQIDYQNAAAALNTQMKKTVLAKIGPGKLTGKKVKVVGAFQLINPDGWLVTPVSLDVT